MRTLACSLVLKPSSVNFTEYVPTGRFVIRYCPSAFVVAARTFSISAGLETSTSTPGITAPDVSRTVPVIWPVLSPACASAAAGTNASTAAINHAILMALRITLSSSPRHLVHRPSAADHHARSDKDTFGRGM